jgi:drug/metabolite transporter (DMT)-like permease
VSSLALALALSAACLHAFWNLLIARARDTEAATAVALCVGVVVFAPVCVATWDVERGAIPYLAASSALELAYVALLAAAYRRSDLSLVYPVARGLAPVLVLVVATLALGAATSPAEALGVAVVVVGVLAVRGPRGRADRRGLALALTIAATIAAYTLVDNSGIELASAASYFELALVGPAVLYAAAILAVRGRGRVATEITATNAVAGVTMFGAYLLVLLALRHAPAASVSAVRESSVVIATALAAPVLKERVTPMRLTGAVLVVAGVALLALG